MADDSLLSIIVMTTPLRPERYPLLRRTVTENRAARLCLHYSRNEVSQDRFVFSLASFQAPRVSTTILHAQSPAQLMHEALRALGDVAVARVNNFQRDPVRAVDVWVVQQSNARPVAHIRKARLLE